ncbi:MAG TPA: hypothetical protein VIN40_08980 [Candidatus Tyrphobacter sp.]
MIYASGASRPRIHESAYVAPSAIVSGDVTIAAGCAVLHGAVIAAEGAPIEIGEESVIMEHAVLRASGGESLTFPLKIGKHCIIGPHGHLAGGTIADGTVVQADEAVVSQARDVCGPDETYAKFLRKVHAQDVAVDEHKRPAAKRPAPAAPPPMVEVEGVDNAMMLELQEMEHKRQESLRKQREHK